MRRNVWECDYCTEQVEVTDETTMPPNWAIVKLVIDEEKVGEWLICKKDREKNVSDVIGVLVSSSGK
jgi:hypothetical protein